MIRYTLAGLAALVLSGATPNLASAQGTVQPIFKIPGMDQGVSDLAKRVADWDINLDTKKIADALDKGFPNLRVSDSLSDQAKKAGDNKIQLAGGDPKENGQNPNGNGNSEFKQTLDAINSIFKTQADLIRSIDISSASRINGMAPAGGGPNVTGGRTGLELAKVPPELAEQLKLPPEQGLLIKRVFPKTPAEAAGYKANDVLMELNGKKVPGDLNDFYDRVFRFIKNDAPFTGQVIRGGEKVDVAAMKVTDRRVIPALPGEKAPDLTQIIQVAPGINSSQPSSVRVPEVRIIPRPGGINEIILVDPNKK